jgi:hypothetical protein
MVAFIGKGADEVVVDSWDGCKTILDATTSAALSSSTVLEAASTVFKPSQQMVGTVPPTIA